MQTECTIGQSRGETEPNSTEDLIYSTKWFDGFNTVFARTTYTTGEKSATTHALKKFLLTHHDTVGIGVDIASGLDLHPPN